MAKNQNLAAQEEIVRIAAEAGAKVALETYFSKKRENIRKRHDRRLRNTKLLLRNYGMLVAHVSSAVYKPAPDEEDAVDIFEILEEMDDYYDDENLYVESIKRSRTRTAVIMQHIDEMLRLYEIFCNKSPKPEDRRRYNVLHALYIAEEPMLARDIAEKENIDVRTVYKDIDAAVEKVSALIFGIDGLRASNN